MAISICTATPITFTSEVSFDHALGGTPVGIESFETVPVGSDPMTFPTVRVHCDGGATCTDFFGTSTLMPTDGTLGVRFSGTDTLTFNWDTPITYFAIDVRDLGTNGPTDLIVTVNGKTITVYSNFTGISGNTVFVGIVDPEGIYSLSITTSRAGDGIYVDRLQTVATPEPAASGLVLSGLALLGLGRKMRSRRSRN
jgi:hypothetical protein